MPHLREQEALGRRARGGRGERLRRPAPGHRGLGRGAAAPHAGADDRRPVPAPARDTRGLRVLRRLRRPALPPAAPRPAPGAGLPLVHRARGRRGHRDQHRERRDRQARRGARAWPRPAHASRHRRARVERDHHARQPRAGHRDRGPGDRLDAARAPQRLRGGAPEPGGLGRHRAARGGRALSALAADDGRAHRDRARRPESAREDHRRVPGHQPAPVGQVLRQGGEAQDRQLRLHPRAQCLRDGTSEVGGAPSAGRPNRESAADADPNALRPVEVVDPETGATRVVYRDSRGRS